MKLELTPALQALVEQALRGFDERDFGRRLWERDTTLWKSTPAHQAIIAEALGWLSVPADIREQVAELVGFVDEVRAEGYTDAVLLGMGGSSLAPEVLRRTFGVAEGYLDLHVLDSTDPQAVLDLERSLDFERTLFVVASKSGGTTETASFHAYFYHALEHLGGELAGRHFVAITDEDTSLQREALAEDFRAVFVNPSDIGGRYSALSFFGLVPGALIGLDLDALLGRALAMADTCAAGKAAVESPGAHLGAVLGGLAGAGRDKLTLLASPGVASFGAWVEQLVAESTGKEGMGIVPVDLEPPAEPARYGDDRLFVYVRLAAAADAGQDMAAAALAQAGQPVVTIDLDDPLDLGGEFLRWEIATAAAGALLGIDPFDQPNVQESKDNTKRLLAGFVASGELMTEVPGGADAKLSLSIADDGLPAVLREFLAQTAAGDYVALQAYVAPDPALWDALQRVRAVLRDRLRVATTLGYGPRFLHSTGQLHKGGPNTGLFLQLVGHDREDASIPGQPYSFSVLKRAQARGDFSALRAHGCRALRICLGDDVPAAVAKLLELVEAAT
jgi:transaldolase/glucose-6-phosphate isomerase